MKGNAAAGQFDNVNSGGGRVCYSGTNLLQAVHVDQGHSHARILLVKKKVVAGLRSS
jgi:hypothetical protein